MSDLKVQTRYRKIISEIPHPASRALLAELQSVEPRSMASFPPVAWDRAEGFQVYDAYGNVWIDFSSVVLLANAGHAHPKIGQAIIEQLQTGLWHNYCNPSEIRLRTVKALAEIIPPYLNKTFLLTTGAEAVECAIKLMRLYGRSIRPEKINVLSFWNSFHGRTMGAQIVGGFPEQQEWMGQKPGGFYHIAFPECARCPWGKPEYQNCGVECLERSLNQLRQQGVDEDLFAGVITETYQGPTVAFMPIDYAQALREWANQRRVLLVFDEIQAGFGRTGKWFGFEHYGVEADLLTFGKGMTSCLPMSAVVGRGAIMDLPEHGEMSSTHTGNPLSCAAAIANIRVIREERLVENAATLGQVARQALEKLRQRFPQHVGAINGQGLAWAVYLLDPATKRLDPEFGKQVIKICRDRGLFMLQVPIGTLKVAPPLCITEEALLEGVSVIEEVVAEHVQ